MNPWHGKRCLVTGATSGVGRALALELRRREAQVVAVGRNSRALGELFDAGCDPLCHDLRAPVALIGRYDLLFAFAGAVGAPLAPLGGLERAVDALQPGGWLVLAGSIATAAGGLPGAFGDYQREKRAQQEHHATLRHQTAVVHMGIVDTPIWEHAAIPAWLSRAARVVGHSPHRAAADILAALEREDADIRAGAFAGLSDHPVIAALATVVARRVLA